MQPEIRLVRLDDLCWDSAQGREYADWLSEAERTRQRGFKQPERRRQFLLSRVLLRGRLGRITGKAPGSLQFVTAGNGKPQLVAAPELHFSLSHSGQWVGLAIGDTAPLGLDLEHPTRARDFLIIARHYFHPEESALLEAVPECAVARQFYRLWTLKEAFFKARGTGIYEGLARINFAQFEQRGRVHIDPDLEAGALWQFYQRLDPAGSGDDLYLALAGRDEHIAEAVTARGLADGI